MKTVMPALFLSHGTPMLLVAEDDYTEALQSYIKTLPRPKAIIVVSSHGISEPETVSINTAHRPGVQHDFVGFPGEFYLLDYLCPGSPELAVRAAGLLSDAGFQTELSTQMRLDYAAWAPLRVAYPDADIPIVQISMPYPTDPRQMLKIGRALAPLRAEDILLVGTGAVVYNMNELVWFNKNGSPQPWAREFQDWCEDRLKVKNVEDLVDFVETAPGAKLAHPDPRHFHPLLFTLGAAWPGETARPIFREIQYTSISMFSFALTT